MPFNFMIHQAWWRAIESSGNYAEHTEGWMKTYQDPPPFRNDLLPFEPVDTLVDPPDEEETGYDGDQDGEEGGDE